MANWRFFIKGIEVEEPIGWDGIEFTAKRMDSHGIDQPFSTEISFDGKGAKILKESYDTYFINEEVPIKIESDVYVNGEAWEFNGFVNMSIYTEKNVCDTDSWEITVGIIDDNFRERFKSRMGVDVDIYANKDLDGNTLYDPNFDLTRLHTQEVYLVGFAQDTNTTYPVDVYATLKWIWQTGWTLSDYGCSIPAFITNTDFKGPFGTQFDPQQVMYDDTKTILFRNNSKFDRTLTFNTKINGQFVWNPNMIAVDGETANITLSLLLVNPPNPFPNPQFFNGPSSGLSTVEESMTPVPFDFLWEQTVTVKPLGYVHILIKWGSGGTVAPGDEFEDEITRGLAVWIDKCCLTITEKNSAEYASFAETLRVENFLRRLINIITGDSDGLLSDAFSKARDGCYWNFALTNGLKIRQAKTIAGATYNCDPLQDVNQTNFKVNFNDLFDGLNSIFCLGWAFEYYNNKWKIRIEPLEYFYRNRVNFIAENVGEVLRSAMTNDLVNQVQLGYDDTWKNIQAAGIWAIHTDRNYYIDNRAMAEGTTKKFEMLSNIIAEGYAIEFSRRMYFFQDDSGSSDRPNDYELFIIWLNRNQLNISAVEDSEYAIKYEDGPITFAPGTVSMSSDRITYSGSEVGALYNIYITPARNAARWWKFLGMHTFGLNNPRLRFQSGEYQITYSSTINGNDEKESCIEIYTGNVAENSDIYPAMFNEWAQSYLFKPIEIEFSYPQSLCDFINLADNKPYGKIKLTSGSLNISGYITEISNKPEDDNGGTTTFKLLASNIADPEPPEPPQIGAYSNAYSNAYDI